MGQTPRPVDPGVAIGQVFLGKYRVDQILGQGGMGVVAKCMHLALNERVAIKMLRKDVLLDRDAVERFTREARAAVKLRSEYVARVLDVGTFENGAPYMVMEFLDGHDLGELIDQRGCLPAPWATELMLQAAEALSEAHSIGIVHRDVKPTNLFVTWRPDGTALIKVLDFGISKAPTGTADMQLTQTQSLLGTPSYMSPEQMRSARTVDARSDIWSLGTVMYELLEGRRPFEAESFSEMCVKVAVDPPSPMVNAPPALQQIVLRCLAKSPEQRYASMADLGRELVPFAQDPHQAAMLVERMVRMLGRRTPVPVPEQSAPIAPPPNVWQSPSMSDASVAAVPRSPTHREPSGRARAQSEVHAAVVPGRRRRFAIALLAAMIVAGVGVGLAIGLGDGDRATADQLAADKLAADQAAQRATADRLAAEKATADKLAADKLAADQADKLAADKLSASADKPVAADKAAKALARAAQKSAAQQKAATGKRAKTDDRTIIKPEVPAKPLVPEPACNVYQFPHGCPRS